MKLNSIKDIFYDDEDLDIVALVSTDEKSVEKFLVFKGEDDQFYGCSIDDVEEVLAYKELQKVKSKGNKIIQSTADIRGNLVFITKFGSWFKDLSLDDEEYEFVVIIKKDDKRVGVAIKDVIDIYSILPEELIDNSINDNKTDYVTKIEISNIEKICEIVNFKYLILDIFGTDNVC